MTDLKELAEWSKKFLSYNTCYNLSSDMAESCLFHKWHIAPVLMHLGKREMEKLNYDIRCDNFKGYYRVYIKSERDDSGGDWQLSPVYEDGNNEYIAFWTAVRKAMITASAIKKDGLFSEDL